MRLRRAVYFTAVFALCLHGSLINGQELEFSQSLYQTTLIEGVTSISGSYVVTLGFNRPLSGSESLIFISPAPDLFFNTSTLEVFLEVSVDTSFSVIVGVSVETLKKATIEVEVINPAQACQIQAAGPCSQICDLTSNSQSGYTCSCIDGYTLHSDGRTCIARDPTPLILLSHSDRISLLDTFRRESSSLYQLDNNNNNITLFDYDYRNQLLYFLDKTYPQIVRTSLNRSDSLATPIITTGIGSVSGLAVDWVSGNVLYSDSILGTIQQYHVTTGHVTPVVKGLNSPRAIALIPDEPFRYLFWIEKTSSDEYSIMRSPLNGSMEITSVVVGLTNPVAMAIDVVMEQLYWISDGGIVWRSPFDGSNVQGVYDAGQSLDSIAVFEDYVYLSSSSSSSITRINKLDLDQAKVEYLLSFSGIQDIHILHPLAQPLTVDADECLINNGGCNQGCVNTVGSYYCSCIHGYNLLEDQQTCVNRNNCSVDDLECDQGCGLDDSDKGVCLCNPGYQLDSDGKTCSDVNECLEKDFCSHGCHNTIGGFRCSCPEGLFIGPDRHSCIGCSVGNGGCSQICVTLSDAFQCQCETGYTLGADKRTCFPQQASSLIASVQTGQNLMNVIETTPNGVYLKTLVKLSNTQSGVSATGDIFGMDVDVSDNYLYFGDRNNLGLFRVGISDVSSSTDGRTRIVDDVKIWGVAYDWVNEQVYWTEDESGKIKRVRVNGNEFSPEVVLENLDTPQGLTIEPFTNYMYWTEGGNSSQIARALLADPSNTVQVLVSSLGNPTGITIDYINGKLIWADQVNRKISFSNLDGQDVLDLVTTSLDQSPFQIVVTGDKLYWSTVGRVELSLVTLYDSSTELSLSLEGYSASSINGLTVIDENKKPGNGYHACLVNALGCSHYCSINSEGEAVCTCPVGYVLLQDEITCANIFFCPGSRYCDGSFANTTGIPFFSRPSQQGQRLNSPDTPLMVSGQVLESCDLQSVEFLDHSCQYETVTADILTVVGSGLYVTDPNSLVWTILNGRVITITLTCTTPSVAGSFCVNFEVSSLDRAVSCGFSNGGCSDFCTTEFSPIPVCTCPGGQVLGQNGYDCIDPCQPSPCQNGGQCSTDPQGSVLCICPQSHSGPFCSIPSQPDCPQDFCDSISNSFSVQRLVGGDLVTPSSSPSEVFCNAIDGYCIGSKEGSCDACQCGPQDSFIFETKRCSKEDCSYRFGQVSQQAPPMYIKNNELVSVATGNRLPIVHSITGSPLGSGCVIKETEVNTGDGWTPVSLSGIELTTEEGNTYLNVGSGVLLNHLRGQLIRTTLTCGGENGSCLVFSFYGNGIDLSSTEVCNSCEGHLEGYENLGIPIVSGPNSSGAAGDFILSDLNIIHDGNVMNTCNEVGSPLYYDEQCGLVSVPDNLIYASQNRLLGRNSESNSWNTIAGKVINITLLCNSNVQFCLLVQIEDTQNEDAAGSCSSNPCENNGTCVSIGQTDFHCTCQTGFTGLTCSNIDHCMYHRCLNNGTCINGPGYATCICPLDTIPPYCIGPDDNNFGPCELSPCNNGGTCVEDDKTGYFCTCEIGFTGLHCDLDDPCVPNPCSFNSSCMPVGSEFICELSGGGGGSEGGEEESGSADDVCEMNICQNGGTCNAMGNSYVCTCPAGYTGITCDVDIDECDSNPCQNGGSCEQGSPGEFTCTCSTGYTGTTCDVDIDECDSNPCQNGGSCEQGSPGEFTCTCSTGYTGTNCDVDIDECDSSPCQNGGSCEQGSPGEFTCICSTGYTGTTCDVDIDECDSSPCLNRGVCSEPAVGEFLCNCTAEYTGETCQDDFNECAVSNPCENGGTCVNRSPGFGCQCASGYIGERCEQQCPDGQFGVGCTLSCGCLNGASCNHVTGVCICVGYTGSRCETPVCDPSCQNQGTCTAPDTCSCVETFTGPTCTQRECTSGFCNDRGDCQLNIIDQPFCTCQNGFTGPNCEITISSQLSSEEKGGVSGGVVVAVLILAVVIAVALFFIFKVVIPRYRRKKAKRSLWYLDTTLVRGNPAVAQELLDSTDVAREFRDQGMTHPLDNPLYGYIPPRVNPESVKYEDSYASVPTEDNSEDGSSQEDEENERSPFRPNVIPNTVIVNRCIDVRSPDSSDDGEFINQPAAASPDLERGERDSKMERDRSEWRTTDKRNSDSGENIV